MTNRAPGPVPKYHRPCKLVVKVVRIPTRTCVGCGVRADRSELVRLVAAGDEIVPDAAGRLPGRGAYLHPSLACLERAQRRRAFPRALRLSAALPDGKVAEYLAACG